MPLIKSAIKRMKQSRVRQKRNEGTKIGYKKAMRAVVDSVKDKKPKEAKEALKKAYKVIDTATKKNILHKNNAARKKSRMSKLVNSIEVKAS